GRLDSAVEDAQLLLNAGRSVGDYPNNAMQVVRMACQSVSILICERAIAQGTISDIALAKVQNALQEEGKDPSALYAVRGERVRLRQSADRSRSDDSRLESAWKAATGKKMRNYPLELHLSTQLVEIAKLPVEQQPPAIEKLKSGIPDLRLL